MTQYISKSALVAEIKRQLSSIDSCPKLTDTQIAVLEGDKVVLTKLLSFINTLEVNSNDAFIKKTEKWIDNFLSESTLIDYKVTPIVRNAVIENFKNYMKGE